MSIISKRRIISFLVSLCFLLVGCSSSLQPAKHNYVYSPTMDFLELKQYIASYEISNGTYTSLPYEYPYDIYSTYYSYMALNILSTDNADQIVYTSDLLSKDATSLNSLYYICSLYKMNILSNIEPSVLYDTLKLFTRDGLYVLDNEDDAIFEHPDIIIYSIYLGILCEDILQNFVESSIDHTRMITWLNENSSNFTETYSSTSLLEKMNMAFQLYRIYSFLELDYTPFKEFLNNNFNGYVSILISAFEENDVYAIFELPTYWDILDIIGLPDPFLNNHTFFTNLLNSLSHPSGGYALPQDTPNPLIFYIVSLISQKYNIDIDYSIDIIPIIYRHQTYNNCFIPYTLFYSDEVSTFYANQILYLLDNTNNYPSDQRNNLYSILSKESLSTEEHNFIDNYINEIFSNAEQELTYGNAMILSLLADKYLPQNKDLKHNIENTISELSPQISELTTSQNILLINALYVYNVTFDQQHPAIDVEVSSIIPRNLIEAYFFTRLLIANDVDFQSLPKHTYSAIQNMITNTFDTTSFSYSPSDTLRDMQSTYYGVFLSGYYN